LLLQSNSQGSRLWAIGRGVGWVKTRVPSPIYRGLRLGWRHFSGAVDQLGLRRLAWRWRLSTEIAHWDEWMRTGGLNDHEDFARRIMPDRPLQEHLRRLLPVETRDNTFRVLDVGAGPLTTVGKVCDGRKLDLICIDPLARVYDAMLEANGVAPPVRTAYGEAERVAEMFAENSFDLVHAFNSLDHAHDPIRAIRSAVRIVKPGGFVYLWHWLNEGQREHYGGLHQWNFGTSDNSFTITSNAGRTTNISDLLRDIADVTCEIESGRWLTVYIRKRSTDL
jgi:SAM-dependent methyltransferase